MFCHLFSFYNEIYAHIKDLFVIHGRTGLITLKGSLT